MSGPTLEVLANEVKHLTDRADKLEERLEAVMKVQRWQMGMAVGAGAVLTLLLPKISAALGLT